MRWKTPRLVVALLLAVGAAAPAAAQRPEATLGHPILVFGAGEVGPGEVLGSVAAVTGLEGGRWAVADGQSRTIHIVDGTGARILTLGGQGDGPGEFRALVRDGLWALPGGGLGVWDPRAGRVTYIRGEAFDEVETVRVQQSGAIGRPDLLVGSVPEGLLIASTEAGVRSPDGSEPAADRHVIGLFGRDGTFVREVAEFRGLVRAHFEGGPIGTGPLPFSPVAMVARGGDRVAFTSGESPEIAVLTRTGELRSFQLDVPPLDLDRAWRELDALAEEPNVISGFWRPLMATMDRTVGRVPALGALVGGPQHLWVQEYQVARHAMPVRVRGRGAPGGQWTVHDWAGNPVGTVRVPDDFTPLTVTDAGVAGVRTGAYGVETFAVFPRPFE